MPAWLIVGIQTTKKKTICASAGKRPRSRCLRRPPKNGNLALISRSVSSGIHVPGVCPRSTARTVGVLSAKGASVAASRWVFRSQGRAVHWAFLQHAATEVGVLVRVSPHEVRLVWAAHRPGCRYRRQVTQ